MQIPGWDGIFHRPRAGPLDTATRALVDLRSGSDNRLIHLSRVGVYAAEWPHEKHISLDFRVMKFLSGRRGELCASVWLGSLLKGRQPTDGGCVAPPQNPPHSGLLTLHCRRYSFLLRKTSLLLFKLGFSWDCRISSGQYLSSFMRNLFLVSMNGAFCVHLFLTDAVMLHCIWSTLYYCFTICSIKKPSVFLQWHALAIFVCHCCRWSGFRHIFSNYRSLHASLPHRFTC